MGTLYVAHDDAFIGKTDERLIVKAEKKILQDIPFIQVEGIVILGRATVSPAVVEEILTRKIGLTFINQIGHYLGRLEPEHTKNIFVRKAQWSAAGETPQSIHLVKGFVRGKLKNYRNALLRAQREDAGLDLSSYITKLEQAISPIEQTDKIASLRGLEGAGSAAYFGCFDQLIKHPDFEFSKRKRRPATDPVNSLLGFGYTLLQHDIQNAVNIVGFDPYLGYLHFDHYGRPSLALDLMEEFRPLVVDAMVLSLINKRSLTPADFITEPLSNAMKLNPEGKKTFLKAYQQKKLANFKHPVLGRKCTYQEAFEIQGRLLAKYLMGEIEQYPPLVLR
ncbi:CRISPR-associated protein Cas1 [Richelia sinica FACHB-800]|uniref:CRISPR-associated endonuclease Cas1 n=1 Tax=Richelia sinica FACHB-800 TaxID=1357546 RepID=A0A975TBP9_9NOST|nr:type I-D CRISPR-associated endonuclease Cas1d [Richelia sinica]MBD2664064.1 type I-D CRISPR-associated endonuclease Cas1 [Richelia sinica FACHB-800]QXE24971.1 CRISPR-associated protein Cas1 [Richelia sinica FACHB-800]